MSDDGVVSNVTMTVSYTVLIPPFSCIAEEVVLDLRACELAVDVLALVRKVDGEVAAETLEDTTWRVTLVPFTQVSCIGHRWPHGRGSFRSRIA